MSVQQPMPGEWVGDHLPLPPEDWPLRLVCGTANRALGDAMSEAMGISASSNNAEPFPDGETFVKVDDDMRGRDVFILQPTCRPVNDALMELLITIDALRRASASRITAVMPYFGYARQDRKDEGRVPITAKLVANLLVTSGAHRVLTMDLHASQIQGFFDVPVDHLSARPVLSKYLREVVSQEVPLTPEEAVVVSPDVGNTKRAQHLASDFNLDLAIIDKRRTGGSDVIPQRMIGSVKDRHVLMFDDMISTAGTVSKASEFCVDEGARSVTIAATHPVFSGPAVERLTAAPIDRLIVTDTIPIEPTVAERFGGRLEVLSVANLLAEAIWRIHKNQSISRMFKGQRGHG